MDHMKVLKRAWHILWRYRALWVFGIILALTATNAGTSSSSYQFDSSDFEGRQLNLDLPSDLQAELDQLAEGLGRLFSVQIPRIVGGLIAVVAALACFVVVLIVLSAIARWVSETALIKMVDDYEETETAKTVKQGLRMGWSRAAWRMFLLDLVVVLPLIVGFVLVSLVALTPLLAWAWGNTTVGIFGTVAAIGLFFLAICAMIVVGVLVSVLLRLAYRACALENLGVFPAIRRGYEVLRTNLKDVGLMWLIMLGVNLGYTILMVPVVFLLLAISGVAAGLVLLLVRGVVGLFAAEVTSWIIGGVAAGPLFLLVFIGPLLFVGGLREVYQSSVWTLTYREVTALDRPDDEPEDEPADASVETAAEESVEEG